MTLVALASETLGYGGGPVLSGVTIAVQPGERVAILGRSGAGKSTLVSVLYRRLADAGAAVALVPQEQALVPTLSVYHNIYMGQLDKRRTLYNLVNLVRPWRRELQAAGEAANNVGVRDLMRRRVETLSGGQKQRTAVARALFRGGDVLLADEPVSAVDAVQGRAILQELTRRFPTALVALHDVNLAFGFATRVIGLKNGRVALDAPVDGLPRIDVHALYDA